MRLGESNASKEEYYDEATGRRLLPDLVRAARREEVNFMLDWKTWERVDRAEVWRRSRRQPLKTRWVDVNKVDEQKPDVRSRLVAKRDCIPQERRLLRGDSATGSMAVALV